MFPEWDKVITYWFHNGLWTCEYTNESIAGVYMCMGLWLCACFSNAPELPEPTGVLESNLTNHVTVWPR